MADTLSEEFEARFYSSFIRGPLTIGLEDEYSALHNGMDGIHRVGEALTEEQTAILMRKIADVPQSRPWRFDEHGLRLVRHYRGKEVEFGTDYGSGILENALAPVDSLGQDGTKALSRVLKPIFRVAGENNVIIASSSPVSTPSHRIVVHKPRYVGLTEIFIQETVLKQAITSASHTHIGGLDIGQAIMAYKVFNFASPAVIAMGGNSPIAEGKESGFLDFSIGMWDGMRFKSGFTRLNQSRIGIASPVEDEHEHWNYLMSLTPLITTREGIGYVMYTGVRTFGEYLKRGQAEGVVIAGPRKGMKVTLTPTMHDVYVHSGTVWTEARLKGEYGGFEGRSADQQPDAASRIAFAALYLGLTANIKEAWSRLSSHNIMQVEEARRDAAVNGLKAHIGKERIADLCEDLLHIAANGLRRIGEDTSMLDPLNERVAYQRNPAIGLLEAFRGGQMHDVVRRSKVKVA
ncbi:MAG: hypothetical protein KGH72_04770 [Candidatus Micrarchaeota archaeon]|nr:hypothetical protein [Candidatus Micrarchaeota archaeon]